MELRFTKRNQTLIAHISGEIDHHTSGELRLKIDRALEQISGKNIIFCFREVTFMDSSRKQKIIFFPLKAALAYVEGREAE